MLKSQQNQNDSGKSLKGTIFFHAILVISALSSFMFFWTYVNIIPETVVPNQVWRGVLTGIIGVLLLDGGAVAWQQMKHSTETKTALQLNIAGVMAFASMTMAILISACWFILATRLVSEGWLIANASWIGTITIIAATVAQFVAAFTYSHYSFGSMKRQIDSELMADAVSRHGDQLREQYLNIADDLAEKTATRNRPDIIRELEDRLAGSTAPARNGQSMAREVEPPKANGNK